MCVRARVCVWWTPVAVIAVDEGRGCGQAVIAARAAYETSTPYRDRVSAACMKPQTEAITSLRGSRSMRYYLETATCDNRASGVSGKTLRSHRLLYSRFSIAVRGGRNRVV